MKFDRSQLPNDLPEEVVKALEAFSDEELQELRATYFAGQFVGVGFSGEDGTFTKHATPGKYEATQVLEEQIRKELAMGARRMAASRPLGGWWRG